MSEHQVINQSSRKKIGVALGVGTVRGMAHIGVLKVLERENIPIDYMAGSSMGAIVAGMYSAGISLDELDIIARSFHIGKIANPSFRKSGLLNGGKIEKFLKKYIGRITFDQLRIPLRVVCSDICSGEEVVLQDGSVKKALRASTSIPGLFSPMYYRDRILVDGGLVNPVPANIVADMGADITVAVNVTRNVKQYIEHARRKKEQKSIWNFLERNTYDKYFTGFWRHGLLDLFKLKKRSSWTPNLVDILLQSLYIAEDRIARAQFANARIDLLLSPYFGDISMLGFNKIPEVIKRGEKEAEANIDRLKNLINRSDESI